MFAMIFLPAFSNHQKVLWFLLWFLVAPVLKGQVLWGKLKVGMTQREITSTEPGVIPVTEMKRMPTGLVAKLRLPEVPVAGIKGSADFYFKDDALQQVTITFTEQDTFDLAHQQFEELKKHLQAEWKTDPSMKSQRGNVNVEMAAWETDEKIITLFLIGALTKPQLTLHYQSRAFMREVAARPPGPRPMPVPRLTEETQQKAEHGDADAQMQVAIFHLSSGQNQTEAIRWLRKAAEQNHVKAQALLGASYVQGNGVAKDTAEGIQWLQKAGDAGDAQAQNALGFCYASGQGVEVNQAVALKWYAKAAEQRDPQAQFNLGDCYRLGLGVEVDLEEAVKWYRRAAAANYPPALKMLQDLNRK